MLVREVMKPSMSIAPTDKLAKAAKLFDEQNIGCLAVCEEGVLVGILTDRDLVTRGVAKPRNLKSATVRQAMSVNVISCQADDPVDQALALMQQHAVRRLPVLNRKGQLTGIISLADVKGEVSAKSPYETKFYKQKTDSRGRVGKVELMSVAGGSGQSQEAAAASAIEQFEKEKQIASWRSLADEYKIYDVHHEDKIRRLAYEFWEREGWPEGRHMDHWRRAEEELAMQGGEPAADGAAEPHPAP